MRGRDKGPGGVRDFRVLRDLGEDNCVGIGVRIQVLSIIRMTGTRCHWEFDNEEVIEPVNSWQG